MLRVNKFIIIVTLLSMSFAYAGQHSDHLRPTGSYFWEGAVGKVVRETLLSDLDYYATLRVIAKPSFEGEWVLSVLWNEDRQCHFLHIREMRENSWYAMIERRKPKFKYDEYIVDISENFAKRLFECWSLILEDVRYPESNCGGIGGDGITYYFSAVKGLSLLEGQIWSPDDDTKTGKLIMLAYALKEFVKDRDKQNAGMIKNVYSLCDDMIAYNPERASELCDSESVIKAQTQLAILGHFVGRFGEMKDTMTEKAIRSFEREHGLEETGRLTHPLMELIREDILKLGMVNLKGIVKKRTPPFDKSQRKAVKTNP